MRVETIGKLVGRLLQDVNPKALTADGLDGALIGYVERCGMEPIALYDRDKVIQIFMSEGMTREDAEEHFNFNVIGSGVGDGTPAFATIYKGDELGQGKVGKGNAGRVHQRGHKSRKRVGHGRPSHSRHR